MRLTLCLASCLALFASNAFAESCSSDLRLIDSSGAYFNYPKTCKTGRSFFAPDDGDGGIIPGSFIVDYLKRQPLVNVKICGDVITAELPVRAGEMTCYTSSGSQPIDDAVVYKWVKTSWDQPHHGGD